MDELREKFIQAMGMIEAAQKVLFVAHVKPDGDAVASLCAMMEIAKLKKKDFTAYAQGEAPRQFNFLSNFDLIESEKNWQSFADFDLIIALDCGELKRTNLAEEIKQRGKHQKVIEIDHHPRFFRYSDVEIRNPSASSTVELIYQLLTVNKIKINRSMADAILTGIIADTNNLLNDAFDIFLTNFFIFSNVLTNVHTNVGMMLILF
jgi:phosphoesterase RecJ-like protein